MIIGQFKAADNAHLLCKASMVRMGFDYIGDIDGYDDMVSVLLF